MQCFTITTRGTLLSLLFSLLCYAAPTFRIQSNTANQHLSSSSPLHCSHGHHRNSVSRPKRLRICSSSSGTQIPKTEVPPPTV
ncbi:uncharacterized protein LOC134635748 isoform X3 [Pelmatolapia mariae]|uniref:uncharacterized protein LOC134635748 isoform X3 n=1 Tax=Pelmatolapia mariae TaxID=158779 RepID=UPI003211E3E5